MARVTSKRQVTIPKVIADRYGIVSGDELEFLPAGDAIRVQRAAQTPPGLDRAQRIASFEAATERLKRLRKTQTWEPSTNRDWRREDLYIRGQPR